jgi:hypothetical protein
MADTMAKAQAWSDAMKAKGHTPILGPDGSLDYSVYKGGYHNGPGCESCGWSCCWHCESVKHIPECSRPTLTMHSQDK